MKTLRIPMPFLLMIGAVLICSALMADIAQGQNVYGVYDKNWILVYYMKNDTVYDMNWQLQYHIRQGMLYDKSHHSQYVIKGDTIYDKNQHLQYRIKEYTPPEQ